MFSKSKSELTMELFERCALSVLIVAAVTAIMWSVGRATLGEAVIALLYLLPIGWIAARWGQWPGICAAAAAALAFDYFFIPPFYSFTVGRLEGWLVLAIFLLVAVVIVGRIQSGFSKAQQQEREAILMFEISTALAGIRTPEGIAKMLAGKIQQVYQAAMVQVTVQADPQSPAIIASAPPEAGYKGRADCILPIIAGPQMVGEICLWAGDAGLPTADSRLLKTFANQGALALERVRLAKDYAQ